MGLEIVEGIKGAGKTAFTTYRAYQAYKQKRQVFCNYKLNFPFKFFTLEVLTKQMDTLQNATIIIDEAHLYFDAREFSSKKNQLFNKFQSQTRKRKLEVILTSQQYENVDLRIRKNLDVIHTCYPYRLVLIDGQKSLRKCTLREIENQQVSRIMVHSNLLWAGGETKWLKFDPSPYFKLYDSDEYVDII